ncbi:RING finger protein nhl-1-like [Ptychodera flava]|uniref:RING finger protein nhl-1-like n=1 Tax=Ptychodera flava TaxID=63121 RepID=UPI00396A55A8
MAAAGFHFFDGIEDNFLECGICFDWYRDANILPCLHSFCGQCMDTVVDKDGKLYCPMCRRSHEKAERTQTYKGAANKPVLKSVRESERLPATGNFATGDIPRCAVCKDANPSNKCIDCTLRLCYACSCVHRNISASRSHILVDAENNLDNGSHSYSVQPPAHCTIHSKNELSLFCTSCDVCVCLECTTRDHKHPEHKCTSLKNAANDFAKDLAAMVDEIKSKEKEVNQRKHNIQEWSKSLVYCYHREGMKMEAHKKSTIEGITRKIEENSGHLFEELRREYERRRISLQAKVKELENAQSDLAEARVKAETLIKCEDMKQVMSARKDVTVQIKRLLETETKSEPIVSDYMQFEVYDDFCKAEQLGVIQTAEDGFSVARSRHSEVTRTQTIAPVTTAVTLQSNGRSHRRRKVRGKESKTLGLSTNATTAVDCPLSKSTLLTDAKSVPAKLNVAESLAPSAGTGTVSNKIRTELAIVVNSGTVTASDAANRAVSTSYSSPSGTTLTYATQSTSTVTVTQAEPYPAPKPEKARISKIERAPPKAAIEVCSVSVMHARPEHVILPLSPTFAELHVTSKPSETVVPLTEYVTPKAALAVAPQAVSYSGPENVTSLTIPIGMSATDSARIANSHAAPRKPTKSTSRTRVSANTVHGNVNIPELTDMKTESRTASLTATEQSAIKTSSGVTTQSITKMSTGTPNLTTPISTSENSVHTALLARTKHNSRWAAQEIQSVSARQPKERGKVSAIKLGVPEVNLHNFKPIKVQPGHSFELRHVPEYTRIGEEFCVTLTKQQQNQSEETYCGQVITAEMTSPTRDVQSVNVTRIEDDLFILSCHGDTEGEHTLSVRVHSKPIHVSPVNIKVIPRKGLLCKFGQTETGVGQLGWLRRGVALSRGRDILVCEPRHQRLQVFTLQGNQRRVVQVSGFARQCIPLFAAVSHKDGHCYITDGGNKQILVCDEDWKSIRCFGKGHLTDPRGIAVNPTKGKVYVVDHSSHRVKVFRLDGRFVSSFGNVGGGDGQLNHPWCVAVDSNTGNVYVSDSNNNRVSVFTEVGEFLYTFSFVKRKPGTQDFHTGIAVDRHGHVYVSNNTGNCVMKYDKIGNFVGRVDNEEDDVKHPLGVCVSDDEPFGKVIVVEEYTGCVKVFAQ